MQETVSTRFRVRKEEADRVQGMGYPLSEIWTESIHSQIGRSLK